MYELGDQKATSNTETFNRQPMGSLSLGRDVQILGGIVNDSSQTVLDALQRK